ncbi:MAG: hypothetical protein Q9174_007177, partial [Haloplaca sp. 1 TL-2023]
MSSKAGPQIKRKSVPLIGKSAESFQIGPLSPSISDSLTNGTSIPPPDPPISPAKNEEFTMMRPSTPSQQATQQGQLSDATYNRFFPSNSSPETMPGAFPSEGPPQPEEEDQIPQQQSTPKLQKMGYEVSASASPSPYAPSSRPSASPSQSTRRPSSVFRLLPFKRKAASNDSDSTYSGRPQTPGADSVIGSLADSGAGGSLRKKRSGFWGRRKSSLSHVIGNDGPGEVASQRRAVSSGYTGGSGGQTQGGYDGDEEFPPRLKKKKSLTFWRRGSSLGLDKMGPGYEQQQQQQQPRPSQQQQYGENGVSDLMG